ncbi:MAG: hypothetical protein WCK85_07475 [Chlorobium sp.]
MANEENNGGVFLDLFIAVGNLLQNVADTLANGVTSAGSIVQSCTNLCATIVSNAANTASQLLQGVATAITSATTPKQ